MNQMSSLYLYPSTLQNEDMKKPLDFNQIILKLEEKIQIEDKEEVIRFLKNQNYYRFSIFPKLLPQNNEMTYSFEDALYLYKLDSWIKEHLYIFIKLIEIQIKSSLINYFVHNHKVELNSPISYQPGEFYLDSKMYFREPEIETMKQIFSNRVKNSNSLAIKHHKIHRNYCIPFWVLVEEMTLGEVDTLILSLQKKHQKKWIDSILLNNYSAVMPGWISNFRELRNKTFHFARLYGTSTTKPPKIKKEDLKIFKMESGISAKEINLRKTRLLGYLYTLNKLIAFQDKEIRNKWMSFLEDLDVKISDTKCVDLDRLGLVDNWLPILKNSHQDILKDIII